MITAAFEEIVERPDDADTTLRMAFGNEATDRDIKEFARRFGCRVVDSFGSSEFAVVGKS